MTIKRTSHAEEKVTLKEFLSDKIDALEDKMDTIFELNKLAIEKSEISMVAKLESMNEWRGQSKDQMSTYATKADLQSAAREISATVRALEISKAVLDGKASQGTVNIAMMFSVISALGVVASLVAFFSR